jgi:hypothetical protein
LVKLYELYYVLDYSLHTISFQVVEAS